MTAQSCIFRDVLVVPPAGEMPFAGWVAVADATDQPPQHGSQLTVLRHKAMSSLERATARPLHELRARDVDAMIVQR